MIVTCGECSTSFQLDEARIPAEGARVRCSRCKHAFFLENPSASQTDAVHSVAADVAADPSAGTPPATSDLAAPKDPNESTWDGLAGEAVESIFDRPARSATPPNAAEAAPDATASTPEPELDEEDWQFSEEIRVEGDDLESALGSDFIDGLEDDFPEEMLGDDTNTDTKASSTGTFGESEDFGEAYNTKALTADVSTGEVEMPPPDAPAIATNAAEDTGASSGLELGADAGDESARDESIFGSVDDFSSLMEDEEPAACVEGGGSIASESAADLGRGESAADNLGAYSATGTTDDLGDPESWDLVGSDDFATDTPNLDSGLGAFGTPEASQSVDEEEFFSEDAFDDANGEIDLASSSLATGPVGQALRAVGWAATVAAISVVAFMSFQAEWNRWAEAPQSVSAGPMEVSTLGASWVETSRAGAVLRFEGEVRNTSGQAIRPGGVQLALLDADGVRLSEPAIIVGLPLATQVLRESSADVLLESAARASRRFSGQPLAAGEVRAFEALLLEADLPSTAARILLEVETSPPALAAARVAPITRGTSTEPAGAGSAGNPVNGLAAPVAPSAQDPESLP